METQDRELALAEAGGFSLLKSQPTTQFTKLLVETIVALKLSVEQENASGGSPPLRFFKYHTNDGRSVPCITGLKNSFSMNWRAPGGDAPDGYSLEATIWSGGGPSLDVVAFDKPRPETSHAFHLGYSMAHGYAWIGPDSAEAFSPQALADELFGLYLENGR